MFDLLAHLFDFVARNHQLSCMRVLPPCSNCMFFFDFVVPALMDSGGLVNNLIEFGTHFSEFVIRVAPIDFGDVLRPTTLSS